MGLWKRHISSIIDHNQEIPPLIGESELKLYPNPPIDFITLSLSQYRKIRSLNVFDSQGKRFERDFIHWDFLIWVDISNLPHGAYFVEVMDEEDNKHKGKFIK